MGPNWDSMQRIRKVKKLLPSRMALESPIAEGDNPVGEREQSFRVGFPSTAGHVKSCGNSGGPLPKAKYSLVTDSEPVP
jgi:hypothetical protein